MLMKIRDGATGIVAYIIVILITIPFAFWGIQEYFGGPADQKVAEINGNEISKIVFDSQLQEQRRYLKSILGDSFDTLYQDESKLKNDVLDSIIQNALISDESNDAGYRVSNAQLNKRIQAVPQFQKNGKFDNATYQQLLTSQRRSPVEFEQQLRQEESVKQFQSSVLFTSFLPKKDKQQFASLKQQKRDFDYLLISADVDAVSVNSDEVNEYYQENKESFKSPAQVKLEYVEINQESIGEALTYSEQEVLDSYNDDPDRYRSEELRNANHILFKLSEASSVEDMEKALNNAKAAIERIDNGESFADVAMDVSEDVVSAKNGGALGFLSRTDINNPPFVQKLFAMQVGELSAPVRSNLGYQVIQLEEVTPSKRKPFSEVKSQIENELRAEAAQKEFLELAEQLSNLSYVNEDNLDVAADALELDIKTSDWIAGSAVEGIASYPGVVTAAFSDEVLNKGENSTLLELEDGHVAVIRVLEHQEAQVQSLEDVASVIEQSLQLKKAQEALIAKGENALEKLNADTTQLNIVAESLGASLNSPGAILRDDDSVLEAVTDRVFSMAIPQDGNAVVEGYDLQDGQYALVRLNKVLSIDESEAKVETAEWISVQGRYGRREMAAMLKALRETGDVTVFPENL